MRSLTPESPERAEHSHCAASTGSAESFDRVAYDKMCRDREAFCKYVEAVVNPSRLSVGDLPMQRHDAWACYNLITSGKFRFLPNPAGEPRPPANP